MRNMPVRCTPMRCMAHEVYPLQDRVGRLLFPICKAFNSPPRILTCCGEVSSCIGCVFKVSRLSCQNVALANAAQFSSPALLPRYLTTPVVLSPYYPVAL